MASSADGAPTRLIVLAAGSIGAAAFVGLHAADYHRFLSRTAGSPIAGAELGNEMLVFCVAAFALYAGFALIGWSIATRTGSRILGAAPALMFVLSPLVGTIAMQDRPALRPILDPYGSGSSRWLFALADLALVLLPAVVATRARPASRRAFDGSARLALLVCAMLGMFLYLRQQVLASGTLDFNVEAHLPLAVLFAAGVMLGARRPWFPAVHLCAAFLLSGAVWVLLEWAVPHGPAAMTAVEQLRQTWLAFVPHAAATGLGALSDPLAGCLRRRASRAPAPQAS